LDEYKCSREAFGDILEGGIATPIFVDFEGFSRAFP
jgi:hypothetical protein